MTSQDDIEVIKEPYDESELLKRITERNRDLFRSMYYFLKSSTHFESVLFPNHIIEDKGLVIYWIVDSDDYGLGDSIRHSYETMCAYGSGEMERSIQLREYSLVSRPDWPRLTDDRIRRNWELMKEMLPQEEFKGFPPTFDIVRWYRMMTF